MLWPDPTHQPTHPPYHTPIHGWEILHRFQIFKENWNILISSSVIKFLLIPGAPGGGGWVDGVGVGIGVWGDIPFMHACTCMCTHAHMHMHVKHDKHAKHGCPHVGSCLQFLYMCMHGACMCIHVGTPAMTPDAPRHPPPTCPLHRATGSPNTKIQ